MNVIKLKETLTDRCPDFMIALLLCQPLLDVITFFAKSGGATVITGALRTGLLIAVCLYGFIISKNRRPYWIVCGVAGAFWLAHMLNCFRLGYANPVRDSAEYLKLVQIPLWAISFITFFHHSEGLDMRIAGALAINFGMVVAIIGLSYLTGTQAYTYDIPSRGVQIGLLGWFDKANTQSAIVAMLVIGLLLWAYQSGKLWVFSGACVLGFALLYFTGTKLTFYSALLMAAGFCVLFLLAGGRSRMFCIPLLVAAALLVGFKNVSIMEYRQSLTQDSFRIYQEQTDEVMGEDKGYEYTGGEIPEEIEEKIVKVYEEVYGQLSFAGRPLLGELIERFGTERVMEAYHYSTKASVLYDLRLKKQITLKLIWEEQDMLTKILGYETEHVFFGIENYDPENDFSALPYYYGFLGAGLFICFFGYFFVSVLSGCIKNLRQLPSFLTVQLGAWFMVFVLGLGAAQLSGQVLRKPSASVYLSLAAAELYVLLHGSGKLFARYERRPAVTMKKL